jgi:hypothetical protein
LVARAVEGHVRALNQAAGGDRFPDHPGELLTAMGWVAVAGFALAGLFVIVRDAWRVASRPAADLPPEPVEPDDTSAPAPCPACRGTIPAGSSRCPACGWTYATGSGPAEPGAAPDRGGSS